MKWNMEHEGPNQARLTLGGSLTIESAAELRDVLRQAVDGSQEIVIQLASDTEADLACLQLLCSAHRTALAAGRQLTLASDCPDSFSRLTEAAGLCQRQGCAREQQVTCILAGGQQ